MRQGSECAEIVVRFMVIRILNNFDMKYCHTHLLGFATSRCTKGSYGSLSNSFPLSVSTVLKWDNGLQLNRLSFHCIIT